MQVHILGICGTFMGSLAIILKEQGFSVSGSDQNVYPPMSTLLESQGIRLTSGFDIKQLDPFPDFLIIGNVMKRGMPIIEHILNNNIPYYSGPEFLKQKILQDKNVLAVSGTHGKTTTTSMLAHILESAGLNPGFLIGGVPKNFPVSARLGGGKYFVIEADEYDSAFFDKRSKFVHYKPNTLIINNIEFDHADIFDSIKDIKRQFKHVTRLVPEKGTIVYAANDKNIEDVLSTDCWSQKTSFGLESGDHVLKDFKGLELPVLGDYNKLNAMASILAANSIGIPIKDSINYLKSFKGVKRRLETLSDAKGITILDDFAHHPTAIKQTIAAVKEKYINNTKEKSSNKLITIVDVCSNTMRMGIHQEKLLDSVSDADEVYFYHNKELSFNLADLINNFANKKLISNKIKGIFADNNKISKPIIESITQGDVVLFLSNGSCGGLKEELVAKI